jgi:hypothetical protein
MDILKKIIRHLIPTGLQKYRNQYLRKRYLNNLKGKSTDEVFNFIFQKKIWGKNESISGSGSSQLQTATIQQEIPILMQQLGFRSLLDVPCGDFNWMKNVDLADIQYFGVDIVADIVTENNLNYQDTNRTFLHANLISDTLPVADLVLVRDCFVHFSYELIFQSLENLKRLGFKYILTTSFTKKVANHDITTGDWRPINLEINPFNFKKIAVINENCTEGGVDFNDKSLILIDLTSLTPFSPSHS